MPLFHYFYVQKVSSYNVDVFTSEVCIIMLFGNRGMYMYVKETYMFI